MAVPLLPLALVGSIAGGSLIAGGLLGSGRAEESFSDPPTTSTNPDSGVIVVQPSDSGGFATPLLLGIAAFIAFLVFGRTTIQEVL